MEISESLNVKSEILILLEENELFHFLKCHFRPVGCQKLRNPTTLEMTTRI